MQLDCVRPRSFRQCYCSRKKSARSKKRWSLHVSVKDDVASTLTTRQRPEYGAYTQVRVEHQTFIKPGREAIWAAVQAEVQEDAWQQVAVVLAQLESIYRVEFQLVAERALAAFREVNTATLGTRNQPVKAGDGANNGASSNGANAEHGADAPLDQHVQHASRNGSRSRTKGKNGSSSGSSTSSLVSMDAGADSFSSMRPHEAAAAAVAAASLPMAEGVSNRSILKKIATANAAVGADAVASAAPPSPSSPPSGSSSSSSGSGWAGWTASFEDEDEQDPQLAALDEAFMLLVLYLIAASHFAPLSARDLQLTKSLNTDYLWQLFIKANPAKLEEGLVKRYQPYRDMLSAEDADDDMKELRPVLVYKRGYGANRETGRLLLQKLDYLQLLLVKTTFTGVRYVADQAWGKMRQVARQVAGVREPSPSTKQLQPRDDGGGNAAGSSSGSDSDASQAAADESWDATVQQASEVAEDLKEDLAVKAKQAGDGYLSLRRALGAPPTITGAGFFSLLSGMGLVPSNNSTPLDIFDQEWPVQEPARLRPLYVRKVSLPDLLTGDPRRTYEAVEGCGDAAASAASIGGADSCSLDGDATGAAAAAGNSPSGSSRSDSSSAVDAAAAAAERQENEGEAGTGRRGVLQAAGDVSKLLLRKVEVVEPTFKEMLVMYRPAQPQARWTKLRHRILGPPKDGEEGSAPQRRPPILLRVYQDIPMPSWKVVYPDKLLQFRPLDLLRVDLFALIGLTAAVAQAKYDSIILQAVTLGTVTIFVVRIFFGYKRMADRFQNFVNELLRDKTVAGQEGAIEYLATSAALQQFKQAALAYATLATAGGDAPLTADEVCRRVEARLSAACGVQVRFDVDEALEELSRFGLLQQIQPSDSKQSPSGSKDAATQPPPRPPPGTRYQVVPVDSAYSKLEAHWNGLLWSRVTSILQDFPADSALAKSMQAQAARDGSGSNGDGGGGASGSTGGTPRRQGSLASR